MVDTSILGSSDKFSLLPNIVLMTPSNEQDLWKMLSTGLNCKGIGAVRYPRGFSHGLDLDLSNECIPIGKSKTILKGKKDPMYRPSRTDAMRTAKQNWDWKDDLSGWEEVDDPNLS